MLLQTTVVLFPNFLIYFCAFSYPQKLTEEELNSLDELYKAICPERDAEKENGSEFEEMLSAAAEHIQALLDSKNKEIFGTTCILNLI